jgi:phosphate-selective porin
VFANVALPRGIELRAGRFKVPFSLEQLTAATELDFAYRSLTAAYLAPGREIGAMAHGKVLGNRVKYQAGLFRAGGDNTRRSERDAPSAGSTTGGRLVFRPWEGARASSPLSKLAVGASMTSGRIPQGPNAIRGHTYADVPLFHDVLVNGRRRRIGGELEWRYGPVSIRSERIRVTDQRLGEGTDDDDLQDAVANGWYASGTWLVTGEKKTDRIKPSRPLLRGGVGALELAARIERFRFASALTDVPASRDARARTIAADADHAMTFGVKWYPTRTVTLQINVVREMLVRRGADPDAATPVWSRVIRMQFEL